MLATQFKYDDKQMGRKSGAGNFMRQQKNQQDFDNDLDEYVTCASIFKKLRDLANLWV